jgi:lipopolysaccharide/colanic/teichoic acid biosynthesis glycosyltransferase
MKMYKYVKSFFDIALAILVVLLLLILFLPLILILRLTGEGEIFYLQERIGFNNQPFKIMKFATMLKNSINMGLGATTVRNDSRITPVGKFLRKSKINELPQVFNIIKGDMSIVGPRPLPYKSFVKYSDKVKEILYKKNPGITGIASLIFRDEEILASTVNNLGGVPIEYYKAHIYPYKGQLELWYHEHISFRTDFFIIFLTAWQIFFPKSDLVYKIFKELPLKPKELTLEGIHKLYKI